MKIFLSVLLIFVWLIFMAAFEWSYREYHKNKRNVKKTTINNR